MGDWWVGLMGFAAGLLLASIINERDHRNPHDQSKAPRDPYAVEIKHAFTSDDGEEGRCNICGGHADDGIHYRHGRVITHSRPQGTE